MLRHLLFDGLLERNLSFRPQNTQCKHQKVLGPSFLSSLLLLPARCTVYCYFSWRTSLRVQFHCFNHTKTTKSILKPNRCNRKERKLSQTYLHHIFFLMDFEGWRNMRWTLAPTRWPWAFSLGSFGFGLLAMARASDSTQFHELLIEFHRLTSRSSRYFKKFNEFSSLKSDEPGGSMRNCAKGSAKGGGPPNPPQRVKNSSFHCMSIAYSLFDLRCRFADSIL